MNKITKNQLQEMIIYGAEILNQQVERINALNVFPVPDGDTGSNMNMTVQTGVKSIAEKTHETIEDMMKLLSKGMLMGARGNSGVILSQFFRGLSEGLVLNNEVTIEDFQNSLKIAKERAYKSVINAVEGTILTVINDLSKYEPTETEFLNYFQNLIKIGNESLENTPNLLPVLKEVGVVDSGGAGLMAIFEGMNASLNGETIKIESIQNFETFKQTEEHPMNIDDIIYGYCTEMLIKLKKSIDIDSVRDELEKHGDSIVAVCDEDILKTHVHTEEPLEVFAYGASLGDFVHIKSENMRIQAEEANGGVVSKEDGIVVVASSLKMAELFKEVQDVEVIVGGQTLNPSTEDIIKGIKATHAKNVLLLPNNSNIIMASEAAKKLCKDEDINIEIVKTKHMTEALECLIHYEADISIKENKDKMDDILKKITNIEMTKAIKDTKINSVEIKKDDYLIIKNGDIVASEATIEEAFEAIIKELDIENLDIINVMIGKDGNSTEIDKFITKVEEQNSFLDVQTYDTEQPVYNYLISGINE